MKDLLKRTLLSGFGIILPVFLTIYIIDLIIRTTDRILDFLPAGWRPPEELLFPGHGIVYAILFSLVVGLFARHFAGKWAMEWFNRLMERVPVVSSVYKLLREIAGTFFDSDQRKGFKRVVLVEWPRRESWVMAFVTADTSGQVSTLLKARKNEPYVNLFLPTTPNPTSGFFFICPESEVIDVDMTVEAAFKVIISCGTISAETLTSRHEVPLRHKA